MPSSPSIESLELRRADIANQISALGDLRSGSITTTFGRCGKPNCHGHQSENAGHGPNLRLTDQADGKTVTVSLPDPIAVRKAEREIAEFRQLQNLHKQFVEVNARICQLRPAETEATEAMETQEKNGGRDPSRNRPRNRPLDAGRFPRSPPDRPARPSSRGDGDALGHARHAPCRSSGDIPIAAVRSSAHHPTDTGRSLRPPRPLPGVTRQDDSHGCRFVRSISPLFPMPALPPRSVSHRHPVGCQGHRNFGQGKVEMSPLGQAGEKRMLVCACR